jgi:hypothetical protein
LEKQLLIFNAGGFTVALIVVGQSAVDAHVVCLFDHLCFYLPIISASYLVRFYDSLTSSG